MADFLEFPGPYFGGKRTIAANVWERFGFLSFAKINQNLARLIAYKQRRCAE